MCGSSVYASSLRVTGDLEAPAPTLRFSDGHSVLNVVSPSSHPVNMENDMNEATRALLQQPREAPGLPTRPCL